MKNNSKSFNIFGKNTTSLNNFENKIDLLENIDNNDNSNLKKDKGTNTSTLNFQENKKNIMQENLFEFPILNKESEYNYNYNKIQFIKNLHFSNFNFNIKLEYNTKEDEILIQITELIHITKYMCSLIQKDFFKNLNFFESIKNSTSKSGRFPIYNINLYFLFLLIKNSIQIYNTDNLNILQKNPDIFNNENISNESDKYLYIIELYKINNKDYWIDKDKILIENSEFIVLIQQKIIEITNNISDSEFLILKISYISKTLHKHNFIFKLNKT